MKTTARKASSYRGARRNAARKLKLVWRDLERVTMGTGNIYVPEVAA